MSRYIDADTLKIPSEEMVAKMIINSAPSIELDDYVPRDFHDKTCEAMAKAHQAEILELTADRPQGEWIYGEHDVAMCDGYRCDRCGFFVPWDYEHKSIDFINDYKFCPNCGARMKGADDERTIITT